MMGLSQLNLDVPVIKGTSGIVFLSKNRIPEYAESACIRCARCVDNCTVNLLPADLFRTVKKGSYSLLEGYNIADCIECGCCAYECPSRIPLVQWLKLGKAELVKSGGGKK